MDDNSDSPALTLEGHSPVFSKKRKTNARQKKISLYTTATRAGGVPKPESMFAPRDSQPPQSTQLPLRFRYASDESRATEPPEGDALRAGSSGQDGASGSSKENAEEVGERPAAEYGMNDPLGDGGKNKEGLVNVAEKVENRLVGEDQSSVTAWENSNEARVYHCKYAELVEAYDNQAYDYCRAGCLDLLLYPNIPRNTRIQTLHLVSTLVHSGQAMSFLEDAQAVLSEMDEAKEHVRTLKQDNERMMKDLEVWRGQEPSQESLEEDAIGLLEGDKPSQQWLKLDREYEEMLKQKLEEELEGVTAVEEPVAQPVG
ncbi:hypothetical protein LTR56_010085 [Elasticomyces elasticus]|nr:hypothetical protein LTR56_010085 [Elasticomyces elasticus]KAK3658924.1 hypothetical protein LTR22_008749 [Elasticomyces elasticus]KAK4923066.1 hypothetical protein LTR49_009728 [Elasticomyces elasticus]KAK5758040.1 hypothetical protein LTS12_011800 [Elasticomyces elasticus]